jgi:glycosyltransferase involved in cell wall biosynthesis
MALLSVIIPSRNCKYVSKTVDDIFENATGECEVIVLLDGYWPNPPIKDYPNLTIIHKAQVTGMRNSVNLGANVAKGKYIMKCDDHCMFGKGFDEILQKDMEDNWLVNPSRYSMDVEKWVRTRGPVEYLYITYPYVKDNLYGNGLHGKKWIGENGIGENMGVQQFYWKEDHRRDIPIDDMMTFQGSCWFMAREHYFRIGQLDEKWCDLMENEPQELGFKTWLSGGRCVVNKNTWYAHMHKNERELDNRGRTWKLSWEAMRQTGRLQTWYWMNDKWPLATRKMKWFVEHFWPIPSWLENWEEDKIRYENEHPEFCKDFRVFDPDGIEGLPLA